MLIDRGADVNALSDDSRNAAHIAARVRMISHRTPLRIVADFLSLCVAFFVCMTTGMQAGQSAAACGARLRLLAPGRQGPDSTGHRSRAHAAPACRCAFCLCYFYVIFRLSLSSGMCIVSC